MRVSTTIRLLLLLVCAVVLAQWTWTQLQEPAPDKPVMWRIAADDVRSLELRHRSGAGRHFRRTAQGWSEGDPARVNAALLLLSAPEAARRLPGADADPAAYGLDRPVLTITMDQPGQPASVIEIGDATPDGGNHYVRLAGGDTVFLVPSSWFEALMLLLPDVAAAGR